MGGEGGELLDDPFRPRDLVTLDGSREEHIPSSDTNKLKIEVAMLTWESVYNIIMYNTFVQLNYIIFKTTTTTITTKTYY